MTPTPRIASNASTIRLLVRPPEHLAMSRVRDLVEGALRGKAWSRGALSRTVAVGAPASSPAAHDVEVRVEVPDEIGSPRYVERAHELVVRLYDTGAFVRVEADIPVDAFAPAPGPGPRSAGQDDCSSEAASDDHDWVLRELRVPSAATGLGIRVGHPDSGYTDHFALGLDRLDLDHDRDVISGDDDAVDPLKPPKRSFFNVLPNPGHGTSTASVLVGAGDGVGFQGVAPGATLVPIRATESVVQVFDHDVAKAVRWAREQRCHVVSMSLGGKGLFGLQDAIQEAIDDGMIVLAAAGNKVGFVTAPASYDNCVAVAATRPGGKTWKGSSRGKAVDVSAPGSCVWCAEFDWDVKPPGRRVRRSHGTSYAVAHVAGVAALWLAHHGHAALCARYGKGQVQAAFVHVLRRPGVCRRPPGWDGSQWGAGVIDAKAVLACPLPAPFDLGGPGSLGAGVRDEPLARLAALTSRTPAAMAKWVDQRLGAGSSTDRGLLRKFEGELAYHLLAGIDPITAPVGRGPAAAPLAAPATMSPQLRARIRRAAARRP